MKWLKGTILFKHYIFLDKRTKNFLKVCFPLSTQFLEETD
jgi:hypothetical protein